MMRDRLTHILGVTHLKDSLHWARRSADNRAAIADLSAAFGIERGAAQNERSFFAWRQGLRARSTLEHRYKLAVRLQALVVTGKLAAHGRQFGDFDDVAFRRGIAPRAFSLLGHQPVEPNRIYDGTVLGRNFSRELQRKPVRIVQKKSRFAAD